MEFRRRRRRARARYKARTGAAGGGAAGGAIITLLLIAGIVYILASSSAGEWMAKNVMAPAIAFFTGEKAAGGEKEENPGGSFVPGDNLGAIDLSAGDAAPVSAQLTFPGVTCYMLQMGVFGSLDNANAQAVELRARGAAGFILEDASTGEMRYRVMASGYENYESAKSVKERLVGEGTDCALYTLESVSAVFKVTAPEKNMEGVRTGFEALSKARKALAEATIDFDKNAPGLEAGKARAGEILSSLKLEMEPLAAFAPDGGALSQILDAYAKIRAGLEGLESGQYKSGVDFSAAMKYTYLNITNQYAALTEALAG